MPGGTSFFVEVRYQRIAPQDNERQFVPVRVGFASERTLGEPRLSALRANCITQSDDRAIPS